MRAKGKGFLTSVFTNALLIDERSVEFLAGQRLDVVQVSVYGATAAAHEAVTRRPGSFERTTRAVRALTAAGVRVRLACHVQRVNFGQLEGLPALARALGATHSFDSTLVTRRDGRRDPRHAWISVWQQATLYRRGWMVPPRADMHCSAASGEGSISAAGDLHPCELLHSVSLGNLKRATLPEIWDSPRRRAVREAISSWKDECCVNCKWGAQCVPCAALRGFNGRSARGSQACTLTGAARRTRGACAMLRPTRS